MVAIKDIAGTYANPQCVDCPIPIQRWQIIPIGEHACVIQYCCGLPQLAMFACKVSDDCWCSPWPAGFPFKGFDQDGKSGIYAMGCVSEDNKWVKVDGLCGGRKPENDTPSTSTMER